MNEPDEAEPKRRLDEIIAECENANSDLNLRTYAAVSPRSRREGLGCPRRGYGDRVFGHRSKPFKVTEDPSVTLVETALGGDRTLAPLAAAGLSRPEALRALWLCACVTTDDAPTWLIYEDLAGDVWWCRVPDGVEALTLVDAQSVAGGHADPAEVLAWLQGEVPDPWSREGSGGGDVDVVTRLQSRMRQS